MRNIGRLTCRGVAAGAGVEAGQMFPEPRVVAVLGQNLLEVFPGHGPLAFAQIGQGAFDHSPLPELGRPRRDPQRLLEGFPERVREALLPEGDAPLDEEVSGRFVVVLKTFSEVDDLLPPALGRRPGSLSRKQAWRTRLATGAFAVGLEVHVMIALPLMLS